MIYYSRKCINYSRDRKITCGNEILLAGIQYYSRKWISTRGKKYYSREIIITRGNLFITRGSDILLAGEKYWQYMAPEGFRRYMQFIIIPRFPYFTNMSQLLYSHAFTMFNRTNYIMFYCWTLLILLQIGNVIIAYHKHMPEEVQCFPKVFYSKSANITWWNRLVCMWVVCVSLIWFSIHNHYIMWTNMTISSSQKRERLWPSQSNINYKK